MHARLVPPRRALTPGAPPGPAGSPLACPARPARAPRLPGRRRLSGARPGALAITLALAVALVLGGGATARADDFWAHWGDGKAELSGYALVTPRYGAPRDGSTVLVYVTEDFSDSAGVKADPGKHPPADVYPVLKLNVVRDFQTGIYDYNLMTSLFVRTEAAGGAPPLATVAKVSFSSEEWCGHVYQQLLGRGGRLVGVAHSYFDGEADAALDLPLPPGGVLEEQLFVLVRGLRGDWLAPGASRVVPLLPSAMRARLEHKRQAWTEATVRRSPEAAPVDTALGRLGAWTWTVTEKDGRAITFTVEDAAPHRLLGWETSTGERARILGSARLPYWQLNQPGGERYLKDIGLPVPRAKVDGGGGGGDVRPVAPPVKVRRRSR